MACCGKERSEFRIAAPGLDRSRDGMLSASDGSGLAYFEYLGRTGLTAIGAVTGRRYRFEGRGARVAVDKRDAGGLLAVPNLRQM